MCLVGTRHGGFSTGTLSARVALGGRYHPLLQPLLRLRGSTEFLQTEKQKYSLREDIGQEEWTVSTAFLGTPRLR